ncbi:hypothetical protein HUG20_17970 [Salicibibacter cibi]|uniref:Uncharacterized protein n=1 Tax=Salicibibacter cibi TaxID=2743001 RepID=A0A7T6ZDN8_9BACI|nr:CBO0543 family protein [Salicibibacter cibi]QQK81615.1 hypothetical protein HUG20_17970 [Salicibibacter cibi]
MERLVLRLLLVIGLACFPFTFQKNRVKEWGIVFFATGWVVTFLAQIVVKGKRLNYPIRPLPKYFDTNVLYEHLILPLFCVWFNQFTYHAKWWSIIGQAVLYSSIHTLIEYFVDKKTGLVKWRKWKWYHNVASLSMVFIGSSGVLTLFKCLSARYDD